MTLLQDYKLQIRVHSNKKQSKEVNQCLKLKVATANDIDTLVMILKQEIQDLHTGVMQMDEDSLVKQVAKNKVIYNLTKKENSLELVYSLIALSEFYISNEIFEPALKTLAQCQSIKETGDASYLIGVCLFNTNKKGEAYRMFDTSLKQQWIEPSISNQKSTQLECINYMQKIEYGKALKNPERRSQHEEKLVALSYEKIKTIKKFDAQSNQNKGDNYYYGLAMADLAEIYLKFQQYQLAHEKIKTAIQMMKGQTLNTEKLIEFYLISASIADKMKQKVQALTQLKNAIDLIEESKKSKQSFKFTKTYEDIYYLYENDEVFNPMEQQKILYFQRQLQL